MIIYSKNLRSVAFNIDGIQYVIKGMNSYEMTQSVLEMGGMNVPAQTELPDAVWAKIKDKYSTHARLFGGLVDGIKTDGLIFVAKDKQEAKKIADSTTPSIAESAVISKSKTVKILEADE